MGLLILTLNRRNFNLVLPQCHAAVRLSIGEHFDFYVAAVRLSMGEHFPFYVVVERLSIRKNFEYFSKSDSWTLYIILIKSSSEQTGGAYLHLNRSMRHLLVYPFSGSAWHYDYLYCNSMLRICRR